VLFTVRGHHLEQQALESTHESLLSLREMPEGLLSQSLFVDQGLDKQGQVPISSHGRPDRAWQRVGRRPVDRVAQPGRYPPQQALVAFLVLEHASHEQDNDRVAAGLSEILALTERPNLERHMTFKCIEQEEERLSTWVAIADEVAGDPTLPVFREYFSAN
jgi:hypothetical protein